MPCVSFNKVGTLQWYKSRAKKLPETYDPADKTAALATAEIWGDEIPIGLIYKRAPEEVEPLEKEIAASRGLDRPICLAGHPPSREKLQAIMTANVK